MSGMIRRLRWKIVGISMLFVTLVLAAVFTGVMLTARSSLEQSSTRQLEKALRGEGYDGQNGNPGISAFGRAQWSGDSGPAGFSANAGSTLDLTAQNTIAGAGRLKHTVGDWSVELTMFATTADVYSLDRVNNFALGASRYRVRRPDAARS